MSSLIPLDWPPYLRYIFIFGLLTARYFLFAGSAFFLFYVYKKRDWFFMKIQQKYPDPKQVMTEIKYSFLTFVIFGFMVVFIGILRTHGYVRAYSSIHDRGIPYFLFATAFIIFFHDTYFYWAHRLMHHPFLFKYVHRVHHMSKDPTPWAAFAFHPIEAVVEIGFLPILLILLPVPHISFLILSLWMIIFNVMGHLGFELFPQSILRHPLLKWTNTSTNHNMHHTYYNCNYGLYFNIWDRLMNTNHKKYAETFNEVTTRRDEGFKKLREGNMEEAPSVELQNS